MRNYLNPSLRGCLRGIPGAAERRGIAEVQIVQLLDLHFVKYGGGEDVDALRRFRLPMTEQLSAEWPPTLLIASKSQI